jgi:ParB family transcriptional regulator, chromosome partitioning protein
MDLLISDLIDHPLNDHFFDSMDGQKKTEFLESIKTSGIIEPLVVTQNNVIISGHQRKKAAEILGLLSVPCIVREYTAHDGRSAEDHEIKDLIESNVRQRGDVGGSELKAVRRVDELRRIYNISHGGCRKNDEVKSALRTLENEPRKLADVCVAAGTSIDAYKRNKHLPDLSPEMQDLLERGEITVSLANEIVSRLSDDEQHALIKMLPASEKWSASLTESMMLEIEQLRRDNRFFQEDEDAASKRLDELDLAAQAAKEENERIKAGRGTDIELELRKDLEEARMSAARLGDQNRIINSNLARYKELRAIDSELGKTAEQQLIGLCGLILSAVAPLAELPTSIFLRLSQEVRSNIRDVIDQSIDGLSDIRSILVNAKEAV